MTNDLHGKVNIECCDLCDGFLIVKKRKQLDQYFIGCTNYKENGTGCNSVKSLN